MYALDYAIPIVAKRAMTMDYASIPLDKADPLHQEAMVPLDTLGIAFRSHHARDDGGNWPYHRPVPGARKDVWLRGSVAEKLIAVNRRLAPYGVEVVVLDGYRTMACQRGMWDFFIADAQRRLPDATPDDWRDLALASAVDPNRFDEGNPTTWPVHATGAAVDLTLRDIETREHLEFGGQFEHIDAFSAADYYETELAAGRIAPDHPHLWNRRLLHWAMTVEGFQNDPIVFWHYDWGSQLYVQVRRELNLEAPDAAWYGFIDEPPRR
jgi:D-alanyl-D-alanine dipeptidase